MIHFGNTDHGRKIAAAIPRVFNAEFDRVISHTSGDELLGGVIFDGHTGPCIFIHQAGFSRHWLCRDMLWVAFDYPFNQLKCSKVAATIPSTKPYLLDFNKRLGFEVEAKITGAYFGGDMLVLSMTREKCPWLKLKPRSLKAEYL